jgi:hypothetical protein
MLQSWAWFDAESGSETTLIFPIHPVSIRIFYPLFDLKKHKQLRKTNKFSPEYSLINRVFVMILLIYKIQSFVFVL